MTADGTLQLGLEGMPRRLFTCTPSRLTTWADCPRRYRFTYLDRPTPPRGPAWAHNTVGAAAHLALARWWSEPRSRRTAATARALVDRAWTAHRPGGDGFADSAQSERWRTRTGDAVAGYVEGLDPDDEPAGVERTVSARTDVLAVSGRVDRIDRRGNELVVVDYKTGRAVLTDDDARGSLALALYALAAARTLRRACRRVELHHLPTGRVLVHEHTEASLQRQLDRAEVLGGEAATATEALREGGDPDALFPARTSPACAWCDVARVCPEGRAAAGALKRPWDGLAAEPVRAQQSPQQSTRPSPQPSPQPSPHQASPPQAPPERAA